MIEPAIFYREGRFPNVARTLAELIYGVGLVADGHAGSETPANLQTAMPFVRILRVGGGADWVNDHPVVDIEVFESTNSRGEALAEAIRQYLIEPGLRFVEGYGLIDRVECVTGPRELPWADTRVRRFGATYRITARRYRPGD